jgi:hypothetical protein
VIVMIDWAWAYVTYQRGARLITGDIEELISATAEPDAKHARRILK